MKSCWQVVCIYLPTLTAYFASAASAQEAAAVQVQSSHGVIPGIFPQTAAAPAAETNGAAAANPACACEESALPPWADWIGKLPYRITPPLGNLPALPSGPGYYSALDWLTGKYRPDRPIAQTVEGQRKIALNIFSSFDLDYRYLDDPNYVSEDFFDRFHNVHLGNDWLFGTGGQADWRHMNEINSRLSGSPDNFDLVRVRVYADLWYRDEFRIFGELISANSYGQQLAPLATDVDKIDFLNLFCSLKLFEIDDYGVYVSGGRQELLIGSQRLLGPQEWANTRKTYQGAHIQWSDQTYDFDCFWAQPVIPNPDGWSWIDRSQQLSSVWFAYHPEKNQTLEAYWLYLNDQHTVTTLGITQDPVSVSAFGCRAVGKQDNFLWDVEPVFEVGNCGSQTLIAGSATAGVGYTLLDIPLSPTFWAFFDWASGSGHPGQGVDNTFNQIYGFGHYYLGFMDIVGRPNIEDWNFHLWLYPSKWITFAAQYHILHLVSAEDALYSPQGTPSRVSANGSAGTDVGQELTFLLNFHLNEHSDIILGWSELYAGSYIRNTATTPGGAQNPELFYMMYNFRW